MKCSRCGKPIMTGERAEPDPCCGAPDCEDRNAWSHYACLPTADKREADMWEATQWN